MWRNGWIYCQKYSLLQNCSSKLFVKYIFRNKTNMVNEYRKRCFRNNKVAAQRKLFSSVLENVKISIF